MNRKELITKMTELTQETKKESEKHLDAFLKAVEHCVENNEELKLVGHFVIQTVEKAERIGRNPQTGEVVKINAKTGVKIKPGKILKDLANK